MKIKRLPGFSLSLTFCLSWGYLSTLLPGIGYSGDTIKFQYLGKVLGIPHAPGYPLYLVLNHLFVSFFPFGSLAYKVNLLSAIYALGACLVLFKLLNCLVQEVLLPLLSRLALASVRRSGRRRSLPRSIRYWFCLWFR